METFGILGFVFGMMGMVGFSLSVIAIARVTNLTKKLKEFDVLPEDFESVSPKKSKTDDA